MYTENDPHYSYSQLQGIEFGVDVMYLLREAVTEVQAILGREPQLVRIVVFEALGTGQRTRPLLENGRG